MKKRIGRGTERDKNPLLISFVDTDQEISKHVLTIYVSLYLISKMISLLFLVWISPFGLSASNDNDNVIYDGGLLLFAMCEDCQQ